jgi:hypothetical protein
MGSEAVATAIGVCAREEVESQPIAVNASSDGRRIIPRLPVGDPIDQVVEVIGIPPHHRAGKNHLRNRDHLLLGT